MIVTRQDKQLSHIKQSLPFSQNIHYLARNAEKTYTKLTQHKGNIFHQYFVFANIFLLYRAALSETFKQIMFFFSVPKCLNPKETK